VTVIAVTIITAVIATVISTIVVCRGTLGRIHGHANAISTKVLTIKFSYSTISIISRKVLKNAIASLFTVNVSKGHTTSFTAKIFQVLPAGITGNTRYNYTETRGTSCPGSTVGFIYVAAGTTFFCKFYNDVGAHKAFAIELLDCVFRVS
jgi:uncharacterized membrane protein